MLFLVFTIGNDRYAMDVRQIAEVLPLVAVKCIPHAPEAVRGLFNYRGAPVPVIDLTRLTTGCVSARRLSTRIVLVHYPDRDGRPHLLGLIAEKATETARYEAADFVAAGVHSADASYLGPVTTETHGMLQRIDVETVLPPALRDILFKQPMDAAWPLPP